VPFQITGLLVSMTSRLFFSNFGYWRVENEAFKIPEKEEIKMKEEKSQLILKDEPEIPPMLKLGDRNAL